MSIVEIEPAKRYRTGGRDARQKSRIGSVAPAYITRQIPPYEMQIGRAHV